MTRASVHRPYALLFLLSFGCTVKHQNKPGDDGTPSPSEAFPKQVKLTESAHPLGSDQVQDTPELSGFFQPGNFGVLTVPTQDGRRALLTIKSTDVKVQIEGRLAKTVVTQVFQNHQTQQTEGTYQFTLPADAAISRLAMDVEGKMMEGELVERARARQIYEEIVSKRKDPALLEWQGGNRFQTQIFPIPANGTKTVILAYEQIIPKRHGGLQYRYGLPNLEGQTQGSLMDHFSFHLQARLLGRPTANGYPLKTETANGAHTLRYETENFRPSGPIDIAFKDGANMETYVAHARYPKENFFLIDFMPDLEPETEAIATESLFVVDSSASIGRVELGRIKALVKALISRLPKGHKVNVISGDVDTQACFAKSLVPKTDSQLDQCLNSISAGGGTDLGKMLESSLKVRSPNTVKRVILLSDGSPSLGELDADLLKALVEKQTDTLPMTLTTIAVGHAPDMDFLDSLAVAGSGHALRLTPGDDIAEAAITLSGLIAQPLLTDIQVTSDKRVEGLTPRRKTRLARGGALAIMGRLDEGPAQIRVNGNYRGKPFEKTFVVKPDSGATSNLLRNFWARAVIGAMQDEQINRTKVVKTSIHYGVMSRYTSFLVLESDEAYKRFSVTRRKEQARLQQIANAKALKKTDKSLAQVIDSQSTASLSRPEEEESQLGGEDRAQAQAQPAPARIASDRSDSAQERAREKAKQLRRMQTSVANKTILRFIAVEDDEAGSNLDTLTEVSGENIIEAFSGQGGVRQTAPAGRGRDRRVPRLHRKHSPIDGVRKSREMRLRGVVKFRRASSVTGRGTLEKATIVRVVRRRQGAIRRCYEKQLQNNPGLSGRVKAQLTIAETGRVTSTRIQKNTTGSEVLGSCISRLMKRWRFPKPEGGSVTVAFPFAFLPADAGTAMQAEMEQIRSLEQSLETLKPGQTAKLLSLYGRHKQTEKFGRLLNRWQKITAKDRRFDDLWFPLSKIKRTRAIEKVFVKLSRELLNDPKHAAVVGQHLAKHYANRSQWTKLRQVLKRVRLDPPTHSRILLEAQADQRHFKTLVDDLLTSSLHDNATRYQILTINAQLKSRVPDALRQIAHALLVSGDLRPEVMDDLLSVVKKGQVSTDVAELVIKRCPKDTRELHRCQEWLARLNEQKRVREHLIELTEESLRRIRKQRLHDAANPNLIEAYVNILEIRAEKQRAARILSEIVEFAPHDYGARQRYAKALAKRQDYTGSCEQLAAAVQLNPAKRDTFRSMMALRRQQTELGREINACIVNGVSKLPVTRDVSIVLTWDDPKADVDLHVHEANGTHVSFRNRRPTNGGFLYYDITDGYGPEIYVLSQGQRGQYRLGVVYYAGKSPTVSGELTIIRQAGSPSETREVRPFVLSGPRATEELPLGTFTL
ncbi:MAG: VIT domain-containing protein [Myxococcota bacterium]|nr:VIT domain-containing protein [Myxococcota bacterium]